MALLNEMSHAFYCPNAQCNEFFEKTYQSLLVVDEVVCPACGTTIDIRESKRSTEPASIGSWFATIGRLAKKRGPTKVIPAFAPTPALPRVE
jgi:hypothetical protein